MIRRKRKYYIHTALKIILICLACVAGFIAGAGSIKVKNHYRAEKNRAYLCVLNRNAEAGETIGKSDINLVPVIREKTKFKSVSLESCLGKQLKIALKRDSILSQEVLVSGDATQSDMRKLPFGFIRNTEYLKAGDFIDIRISFPNGADFVILSRKEVLSSLKEQNGENSILWMGLNEEEILRMSSGVVDAYLFEGAYIYAAQYMSAMQIQSVVNYPVNEVVEELIRKDPNIVEIAQDQKTLELRGSIYGNKTLEKEEDKEEEKSLIYFD